jgi:predicted permease
VTDWKEYIREHLGQLELGYERETQMIEEMAQHLEAVFSEAIAGGATEQEAFDRAVAHVKDWRLLECELILAKRPLDGARVSRIAASGGRIQKGKSKRGIMGSFLHDVRFGARMLAKDRIVTMVAVLSLALGIGGITAVFSLVDAILLKDLPVRKPAELVLFDWQSGPNPIATGLNGSLHQDQKSGTMSSTSFSYDTFRKFSDEAQTLSSVIAFAELEPINANIDGLAEVVSGQLVSGSYYRGLGVSAVAGRTLTDSDDQPAAEPVAVISHRYWQRRFALAPDTIGKVIYLNGSAVTIVGVTPRGFQGTLEVGSSPDVSLALAMQPRLNDEDMLNDPGMWWVQIIGRRNPGVAIEQSRASLEGIFQQSAREGRAMADARAAATSRSGGGAGPDATPPDLPSLRVASGSQGLSQMRAEYESPLLILLGVVTLVLLIACANVATILLSRAAIRQREIAVRLAVGASRWRLVRQLLTESVLLAGLGGALGAVFANWGKDALMALRAWGGGNALQLDVELDLRVLGFTAAISLLTGILFGLAPAFKSTKVDLNSGLKVNTRNVIGGGRFGLNKALVTTQVALSQLLLIGAGLFLATLTNLNSVDVGFNTSNLLVFKVNPSLSGYKKEQVPGLYQQLLERIESVPGVVSASISRHRLLSNSASINRAFIDGQPSATGGQGRTMRDYVWVQQVRSNFLDTIGIPILAGRGLTEQDDARSQKVAVINQTMARKYFGDSDPIGRRFGLEKAERSREIVIVGIARDSKISDIRMETPAAVYIPYLQEARAGQMDFEIRTTGEPSVLIGAIREEIGKVDPNLPLFDVSSQSEQVKETLTNERLFASLSAFFGLLALLLACLGLYGVMSYAIARRTNEIGIRMALGAKAVDVTRMVMRETMIMVVVGVLIGLGAAIATTRFVESMLFGLTPRDPLTIAMGVAVMLVVAAIAGYIPARRASRVDPMEALRHE